MIKQPVHTLKSTTVVGLSEDARNQLLEGLPVHPGEAIDANALSGVLNRIANFDHDLKICETLSGAELAITIETPGFRLPNPEAERQENTRPEAPASPQFTPTRIRVSASAQAAKLISKVEPEYPSLAKANHIQGVVRLTLILYNDGRVMHVFLVSGHPLLDQAAEDAVKQWMYSPTLVNGTPVEVVTEVEVEFFLPN
jgi:TonB family protein